MSGPKRHENEKIWDSSAPGWAKWEFFLMNAAAGVTDRMLDAANVTEGATVLDLACGAGSQTIRTARRVGPSGRVFANDIASKMLGFVAENVAREGLTNVETLYGPAEEISDSDLRVDAAICRFGLMLFKAPRDALTAIRGALAPGGRFAVLVFGAPQENPFFSATMMIALKYAGKAPPPPGSPGLFALSDPARLERLFQETGYRDMIVEPVSAEMYIASVDDALTMMQEAFGAYRAVLADLDEADREAAWADIRACLKQFETPDGVAMHMAMMLASGENPRG